MREKTPKGKGYRFKVDIWADNEARQTREYVSSLESGSQTYWDMVDLCDMLSRELHITPELVILYADAVEDLLEMADNTAWHLLAWPEFFGFFEPGQGDWMLKHSELDIDGKLPVNPSGGFLSFGEATTAQGVLQVCELVWQLREQAQGRQVRRARVGMSAVLGLGANGASVVLKT